MPTKKTTKTKNAKVLIEGNVEHSNIVVGDNNKLEFHYHGKQIIIPSAKDVARHRAALKERLEKEALTRWGGMSFYIQEDGVTLPIEASPYETGQLGVRTNLQDSLKSAARMLLLGDPGSGKTVALERLAWELSAGNEPVIPLLIKLFKYDGKPLADWVRVRLQECGCLRLDDEDALMVFLQEGAARCVFLFDGLNEVAPEHRNILVGELDRWMSAYPRHVVVITSRVQDELWRKLRAERGEIPAMVVQPIHNEQARGYLIAHLGDAKGDELYRRLDESLLALTRTPLVLWLIKEAGAVGEDLPGNRGELYQRFVARMLQRDKEREMNRQFSERMKERALSILALHISHAQRLTCPRREAVDVVAGMFEKDVPEKLDKAEALVDACARHGLLAGEDELWFVPHQTVQEHFAAVALLEIVQQEQSLSGPARLGRDIQQVLKRKKSGLDALAAEDWWMETLVQLAGISADPNWLARTFAQTNPWLAWWCVQEGKKVDEATRSWIEERSSKLLKSPRVANRRRAVRTLAHTRNERILQPLVQAAADKDQEVSRLAVQALEDMGEVARALIETLLHGRDDSVWKTTLSYLSVRPEYLYLQPESPFWSDIASRIQSDGNLLVEARKRLKKQADMAFEKKGQAILLAKIRARITLARFESGQAAVRYWTPPYGEPEWVNIPDGEFWMGGKGRFDGKPVHKINLPTYQIARVTVTNAQYALYIQDVKAMPPQHWWGGSIPPGLENHPITHVSWKNALAYCQWMSEKIGKLVSLPSETEWEKAARGDKDKREYPWGNNNDWRELRCNTLELGLGTTTPVGFFLNGASPYGVLDMSGNVWEWTRSLWGSYPSFLSTIQDRAEGEALNVSERHVLRGGSWRYTMARASVSSRDYLPHSSSDYANSFRVVLSSPILLS